MWLFFLPDSENPHSAHWAYANLSIGNFFSNSLKFGTVLRYKINNLGWDKLLGHTTHAANLVQHSYVVYSAS